MQSRKTWGWGSYAPAPVLEECMSIWPGHRFPRHVVEQGKDPLEEPRQGGELYAREWLRVLKARPQYVTIADWNNFEEETAIEDSYAWEDRSGHSVPDLYRRITRACSYLRSDELVRGENYRSESDPKVYRYNGTNLIYEPGMPRRAAIILVPDDAFARLQKRLEGKSR
jgi:hypothetical protein